MQTKYLKAAALFASTSYTRYYLNGVYVEPINGGGLRISSTDGHRMFVAFDQDAFTGDDSESHLAEPLIIPNETIKKALTGYKQPNIVLKGNGTKVLGDTVFTPIDGTFPDIARCIPTEVSGSIGQFNPLYLGDFGKAAKILSGSTGVHILHNGNDPTPLIFTGEPNAFGVLMPVRSELPDDHWPKLRSLIM